MNTDLYGSFARHVITVIAGAILANNDADLSYAIQSLYQGLASGDMASIIGTGGVIFAILWSMWIKFSEEAKTKTLKVLSLGLKK
jgi:hypothetical protein